MLRSFRPFLLVAITCVAFVPALQAAEETFGTGVKLTAATPIKDLYASPEKYVGKTVRLDGVVTAVCQEMGCWLAIAPAGNEDQAVRFKVEDGGPIKFPISLKGRQARAEGVFEQIAAGDAHGNEAAGEHAKAQPKAADFSKRYQVKATGVVVQ
jgi:hypothetical protein